MNSVLSVLWYGSRCGRFMKSGFSNDSAVMNCVFVFGCGMTVVEVNDSSHVSHMNRLYKYMYHWFAYLLIYLFV